MSQFQTRAVPGTEVTAVVSQFQTRAVPGMEATITIGAVPNLLQEKVWYRN